jgi:predicted nucleotidyltransferase
MNDNLRLIASVLQGLAIGHYAIALAGSHAKGTADAASDIDMYLFVEEMVPYDAQREAIRTIADKDQFLMISRDIEASPWGGEISFVLNRVIVEVTVRSIRRMNTVITDCLEGKFEIIPATWTSNGYYTYCYLAEADFMKPLDDPYGILARWKDRVRIYPEKLKPAIINVFLQRSGTWIDNFHYVSAIGHGDILFTAPIVLHTVMDMIQVIYAINCRYFPGDKKLEEQLKKLPYCPILLTDNLELLFDNQKEKKHLENQHAILKAIRQELIRKGKENDGQVASR